MANIPQSGDGTSRFRKVRAKRAAADNAYVGTRRKSTNYKGCNSIYMDVHTNAPGNNQIFPPRSGALVIPTVLSGLTVSYICTLSNALSNTIVRYTWYICRQRLGETIPTPTMTTSVNPVTPEEDVVVFDAGVVQAVLSTAGTNRPVFFDTDIHTKSSHADIDLSYGDSLVLLTNSTALVSVQGLQAWWVYFMVHN